MASWRAERPGHLLRGVVAVAALAFAPSCNALFGIDEGKPRPICVDPAISEPIIDDMEDGDGAICQKDGRNGHWYTVPDGTPQAEWSPQGDLEPVLIPVPRGTSHYAAHFVGSGFTDWGALMGFNLNDQALGRQPIDVSSAGGIRFWMKSNATRPGGAPHSRHDPAEERRPLRRGHRGQPELRQQFSFTITAPGSGWVDYTIPFSALQQRGGSARWNPQELVAIAFVALPGRPFDLWGDDVRFLHCSDTVCEPTCTDPALSKPCPGSPARCLPAGSDCAAAGGWCADPLLIDDMEDHDAAICDSGGRRGWWYAVSDATSAALTPRPGVDFVQTPIPGGRGSSRTAARLTGSGFLAWGAVMGLSLNAGSEVNQPYDASFADGISFWVKSDTGLYVALGMPETGARDQGGLCTNSTTTVNCSNPFSFPLTAPNPDWVEYKLPFAAFRQAGGSLTLNPARLTSIDFSSQYGARAFDIWVDDLRFYNCSLDDCTPTCTDPALPVRCPARAGVPAGCRPPGTDCDAVVLGCGPSNTAGAPADGVIASFTDAEREGDIKGGLFPFGLPAPSFTTDGALHIAVNAPPTSETRVLGVVDHFESCVDAASFTGVQVTISGTVAGCTLSIFVEDSPHLFDDGIAINAGRHGVGPLPSVPAHVDFVSSQVTPTAQILTLPLADLAGAFPATPFDKEQITGLGWAFIVDPSSAGGPSACVVDLTIDDVRFY